jgi:hypothetical protein
MIYNDAKNVVYRCRKLGSYKMIKIVTFWGSKLMVKNDEKNAKI